MKMSAQRACVFLAALIAGSSVLGNGLWAPKPLNNILVNGGFESWSTPNLPFDWHPLYSPTLHAFRPSSISTEGRYSVEAIASNGWRPILYQEITVRPDTSYRVSALVAITGDSQGYKGIVVTGGKKWRDSALDSLKTAFFNTTTGRRLSEWKRFAVITISKFLASVRSDSGPIPAFLRRPLGKIRHALFFVSFNGEILGYHLTQHATSGFSKNLTVEFNSEEFQTVRVWLCFSRRPDVEVQFDAATVVADQSPSGTDHLKNFILARIGVPDPDRISTRDLVIKLAGFVNDRLLTADAAERASFVNDFSGDLPFYFGRYAAMDNETVRSTFCQSASLSLSEVCALFGLTTRQIHSNDPATGRGLHQFIEYRDPSTRKMIILDPYFGVQITDDASHPIGVAAIGSAVNSVTPANIIRVPVNAFTFSATDIESLYNSNHLIVGLTFGPDFRK